MKPRMSEASLMSPTTDILTTPKQESIKTPKFREFSSELAALRSPRTEAVDSLHTPLALTTPLLGHLAGAGAGLDTPTLTTPRTADWGLFSPINLHSNCSSPRDNGLTARECPRPADLPLDSSIGLNSPDNGFIAKRRKLKNLSSSHSRSVESDSNSCDTPTTDGAATDIPRDLSKKTCQERDQRTQNMSPSSTTNDLDTVRTLDRVGDVKISSPKWFKHPKHLPDLKLSNKELLSDMPSSYHPSPLAVPSPNWTAIRELLSNTQTPKVLDNFVFDVLPPNTPTAKSRGEREREQRSPEPSQPINYEKFKDRDRLDHGEGPPQHRLKSRTQVTFAECPPRPQSLTPPPPIPVDLSCSTHHHTKSSSEDHRSEQHHPLIMPKQEYDPSPPAPSSHYRHSPPSPPPYPEDQVKEEPRDYPGDYPREMPPNLPPDFPPYYLPQITPQHMYNRAHAQHRQSTEHRPSSPPASPPKTSNHYQPRPQFYGGLGHRPGHNLSSLYNPAQLAHAAQYNMWGHVSGHDMASHVSGHVTMPTPPQNIWSRVSQSQQQQHSDNRVDNNGVNNGINSVSNMQNYVNNLKPPPGLDKIHIKSEDRLSTDSQDSLSKKGRKMKKEDDHDHVDLDSSLDGQPPKKKGKGKGKNNNNKDPNAPKRVFVCPHCNVSMEINHLIISSARKVLILQNKLKLGNQQN